MAVAGGACTAYHIRLQGDQLISKTTSCLRSECDGVEDALRKLSAGETVTVAGSDVHALRQRVKIALGWPDEEDGGAEYDTRTFPERIDAELRALRFQMARLQDALEYHRLRIERLEAQSVRQDK